MPRLSVILPVYNAEAYIERAVESVLAQSFLDWELILVDDGSTDGSPAICDRIAAADGRVRVLHQKNAGLSGARNTGMSAAAGDYAAFLDADDWLAPDAYERMFAAMDAAGADSACCGYTVAYDADFGETVPPPLPAGGHDGKEIQNAVILPLLQDRLREGFFTGMVWRWLFSMADIRGRKLVFTDAYLEDELFLIRYFSGRHRLACVAEGLYFYYQSAVSITRHYFPGFAENYTRILDVKAALIRQYAIPVRDDWRDNCAWAGLLAAVGNEFAPGGPAGLGTHIKNLKTLCAVRDFAHALANYAPEGMNKRKTVVAALLRRRLFLPLSALYAMKNRRV